MPLQRLAAILPSMSASMPGCHYWRAFPIFCFASAQIKWPLLGMWRRCLLWWASRRQTGMCCAFCGLMTQWWRHQHQLFSDLPELSSEFHNSPTTSAATLPSGVQPCEFSSSSRGSCIGRKGWRSVWCAGWTPQNRRWEVRWKYQSIGWLWSGLSVIVLLVLNSDHSCTYLFDCFDLASTAQFT